MKLGVVLLAAGRSLRYGGDKLAESIEGKTLLERALEIIRDVDAQRRVAVVSTQARAEAAHRMGVQPVMNGQPEAGISHSVRLGLEACTGMDAYLFMVGDQPWLRGESVERLLAAYARGGCTIACLGSGETMGNPVVFAARYLPELMALTGDAGGKRVARAHRDEVRVVQTDARELWDMDQPLEGRKREGACRD